MSISVFRTIRLSFLAAILAIGMAASPVMALNMVVISTKGKDAKPLENVVTVATANGDFTNLAAAMDSITDSSYNNRYLIVVGPGKYTINSTIHMKDYVSIAGSGRKVTELIGHISESGDWLNSAILELGNYSAVSDLAIQNYGGGGDSFGTVSDGKLYTQLLRLEITVEGGSIRNYGVVYYKDSGANNSLSHDINDIYIRALAAGGAAYVTGVYFNNTYDSYIRNSIVHSEKGSVSSFGVVFKNGSNDNSINQVEIGTSQGAESTGLSSVVLLDDSKNNIINNLNEIRLDFEDPVQYGIRAQNGGTFVLKNSFVKGSVAAVSIHLWESRLINNTLDGGIESDPSGTQCRNNYDSNLNNVDC